MPKILLVEDEPSLRMLIRDNLEQEGYEVHTVADGLAGLDAWAEHHPDLIILDVMLPGRDGFSLARALRKQDTTTPILFLTAKSRPKDVVEGFEAGGNDYLKKTVWTGGIADSGKSVAHRPPLTATEDRRPNDHSTRRNGFRHSQAAIDLYRKSSRTTHHSRIRITADTESATRRSRAQNLSAGTYLGR